MPSQESSTAEIQRTDPVSITKAKADIEHVIWHPLPPHTLSLLDSPHLPHRELQWAAHHWTAKQHHCKYPLYPCYCCCTASLSRLKGSVLEHYVLRCRTHCACTVPAPYVLCGLLGGGTWHRPDIEVLPGRQLVASCVLWSTQCFQSKCCANSTCA